MGSKPPRRTAAQVTLGATGLKSFSRSNYIRTAKAGGTTAWPDQTIYEAAALSRSTWSGCKRQSLTSA